MAIRYFVMDTLYHPIYSDPGGPGQSLRHNRLRSCPFGTVSKLPPISAPDKGARLSVARPWVV